MLFAVDLFARILGAMGAAAGVVAATIAVLTYRRDRPKLVLAWRVDLAGERQTYTLVITNDGRRPVLLRDAGVQAWSARDRSRTGRWLKPTARRIPLVRRLVPRQKAMGGQGANPENPINEPALLEPAGHVSCRFNFQRLRALAFESDELYAYATTILGKLIDEPLPRDLVGYLRLPRTELEERLAQVLQPIDEHSREDA